MTTPTDPNETTTADETSTASEVSTDDRGATEPSTDTNPEEVRTRTPGKGIRPSATDVTSNAPAEFGLVQVWWGDGKGKTTAALGMGFRAAGHGYRVHLLQFMKGGADSVDAVRGEYNAIAAMPGFSFENLGHYGWAGMRDGSDEDDHRREAQAGVDRVRDLFEAWEGVDLTAPLALDGDTEDGVHLLILDEVLYAVSMDLIDPGTVVELVERAPDGLELVLTGSHDEPSYLDDHADLVTNVRKVTHPIETGQRARQGTEY